MGADESKPAENNQNANTIDADQNQSNIFTCFTSADKKTAHTRGLGSNRSNRGRGRFGSDFNDIYSNPNNKSPILCFSSPTENNNRKRSPLTPNQRKRLEYEIEIEKRLEYEIEIENKNKVFNCCGGTNRNLLQVGSSGGTKIKDINDPGIKLSRTYQNAIDDILDMRNEAYLKPRASVSCTCRGICSCRLKKARSRSDTASSIVDSYESKFGTIDTTKLK